MLGRSRMWESYFMLEITSCQRILLRVKGNHFYPGQSFWGIFACGYHSSCGELIMGGLPLKIRGTDFWASHLGLFSHVGIILFAKFYCYHWVMLRAKRKKRKEDSFLDRSSWGVSICGCNALCRKFYQLLAYTDKV